MYPPLAKYGISSPYGNRAGGFHRGVDIPCPTGTKLPSPIDGHIAFEGRVPAAAKGYADEIICIIQGAGQFVVMGHLSRTVVNNGQRVKKGDTVAYSGNSGFSTGPHLHIELCLGTKSPSVGILAYQAIDITPLLKNYQGGSMNEEDVFGACFITQATRWPNQKEVDAWKKSGLPAWEWVQRNAPNPTQNQERVNAFKACWMTLRQAWPSDAEVKKWQKSGLSAYTYAQRNAPNVIALEKDKEIKRLKEKLDNSGGDSKDAIIGKQFRQLLKEAS